MNGRQYARNEGRIPALIMHIQRCKAKGQLDRVAGFEAELDRRLHEMAAAGHGARAEQLKKTNVLAR